MEIEQEWTGEGSQRPNSLFRGEKWVARTRGGPEREGAVVRFRMYFGEIDAIFAFTANTHSFLIFLFQFFKSKPEFPGAEF